jgi:recombinational DNA repair ATPase RecF
LNLFKTLHLQNWRQFAEVEIPLDSSCVVLTGVNGSG